MTQENVNGVYGVVQAAFDVLPLIRKKLLGMDETREEASIPISHIQALCLLKEEGPMSASRMSERLGIAKPNITPMVDRLIEKGYVTRERSAQDRRVMTVMLLPLGEEKLQSVTKTITAGNWVGNRMSIRELAALERSLRTAVRIISKHL